MHPPLTGLIAAPFTPLHADGSLNLAPVAALAQHFAATGVSGVFVAGTTGEGLSLTLAERRALAERWIEAAAPYGLGVIVQVGHTCPADARALAAHAAEVGANAVASLAPCFFKPATVTHLLDFCAPVAAAAARLPFYFYDIPSMTGVQLPMVEFLTKGRSQIPNLRGLKYTNMDLVQFQEVVRLDGGAFDVLFGHDEVLLAGLVLGARGAVGSTYNFAAGLYQRLLKAFAAGDLETARREQARSVAMIRTLGAYGFLPAAKSVMERLGIDYGPVRPPLRSLSSAEKAALWESLDRLGVLDNAASASGAASA